MNIKQKVYNILKGKFLVDGDALKNWIFLIFLTVLGLIMISSSHSVDRKVQEIAKITKLKKELRDQFIATRSDLMKIKMESNIIKRIEGTGLFVSNKPPTKIKIVKNKEEK
jgi:hypothetical protein